jgi:hypothetical protein
MMMALPEYEDNIVQPSLEGSAQQAILELPSG